MSRATNQRKIYHGVLLDDPYYLDTVSEPYCLTLLYRYVAGTSKYGTVLWFVESVFRRVTAQKTARVKASYRKTDAQQKADVKVEYFGPSYCYIFRSEPARWLLARSLAVLPMMHFLPSH